MAENLTIDFLHNYILKEVRTSDPIAYQYDLGRILVMMIPDTVSSVEVHYWKNGMSQSEAYNANVEAADKGSVVTAHVPNKYFETSGDLRVYVVIAESGQDATMYEGLIPIKERPMPDGYVDDDPDNTATHLLEVARQAVTLAQGYASQAAAAAESIPSDYTELDDRVTALEAGAGGLTENIKWALLRIANKVAYIDEHGAEYYDQLYDALFEVTAISLNARSIVLTEIGSTQQLTAKTTPPGSGVTWASSDTSVATVSSTGLVTSVGYGACTITASAGSASASCAVNVSQVTLTSIAADYQQSGTVYDSASLDYLKSDLTVTATYSDSSTATVTEYTLSGTLTAGTSTITVSYGGKTTTFTVTVTAAPTLSSISAVYTQSGTVYDTDTLDSLKDDLVVTAHYSDSTTQTVTEYTLSGTLAVGTSTVTVAYGGKTTTFTVTVSEYIDPRTLIRNWDLTESLTDSVNSKTASLAVGTQDSSGVHISAANARIVFPNFITAGTDVTIECDLTSFSRQGSEHGRFMMLDATHGFIYRRTGVWALYLGTAWTDSSVSDTTFFNGKTVVGKIKWSGSSSFTFSIYCDDVLIVEASSASMTFTPSIGSGQSNSAYDSTITAYRVYQGV